MNAKNMYEMKVRAFYEAARVVVQMIELPEYVRGASIEDKPRKSYRKGYLNEKGEFATKEDELRWEAEYNNKWICERDGYRTMHEAERDIVSRLAGPVAERLLNGDASLLARDNLRMAARKLYGLMTDCAMYGYGALLCKVAPGGWSETYHSVSIGGYSDTMEKAFTEQMEYFDSEAERIVSRHMATIIAISRALESSSVLSIEELNDLWDEAGDKEFAKKFRRSRKGSPKHGIGIFDRGQLHSEGGASGSNDDAGQMADSNDCPDR